MTEPFDLLVVVRRLRAAEVGTPVLMLTARIQVEDRVAGLDAAADDYLSKPFAFPELLARVRALTRRPQDSRTDGTIRVGDVTLDPVRHVVRRGDEGVELTSREFALLATLIQRPGQVFTRSVTLATVWGGVSDVYANVVDLHVSHLRKKLGRAGEPSLIRTVRGVGYSFDSGAAPSVRQELRAPHARVYVGVLTLILLLFGAVVVVILRAVVADLQDT